MITSKRRRLALDLKQSDMMLRAGISRQQYQRLESKGNPRLDTLELIAQALNSELMLIPKDKLGAVIAVLEQEASNETDNPTSADTNKSLDDDPWKGLLGDD
ncbi:Helix-turn-helix [Marinobacter sp. LV10R510-11A]|uniref:helix-turn-helix transcriptional regulator n=1 Tax=Marinobacter sp. LV10R510-11A TaxID=1415568 RepID=UPI000BB6F03C|nr:helix-turn-helix transcriptional regulator [Marinobacter sp. LV10R510-11A]SOB78477.1 Helix-turn-helix [Marinobacter sp. LV10R510-11A]